MQDALLHPFAPPTKRDFIHVVRGEGAVIWDARGNDYIDAMGGLWFCAVGHGRAEIADRVGDQLRTLAAYHLFDPFTNEPAEELAARLAELTPIPNARVFLTSSGSEAVDTAMKLARLSHVLRGEPERRVIISRERGYHGTNYGGTSAQGLPPNKEGFGELLADVAHVPADDIEALSTTMARESGRVAAVIMEPIQGAAGVHPPPPGYLAEARRLCDQHGALLVFDEVITGFGRLGRWFGAEHYGVTPDLTTFAKAVTSGYQPLGGVIVGEAVRGPLEADDHFVLRHGYTYSGHPAACVAALANIEIIEREDLLGAATKIGARLREGLDAVAADGRVDHVRGEVAVHAVALHPHQDAPTVRDAMLARGVIVRPIGDALTFCPPLVTTDEQIDRIVDVLAESL